MNYQDYEPKRLYRSHNGVIFGVCAGIAEYFDLPPWGVRLVWILLMLTGIGMPVLLVVYVALGLILPKRPLAPPQAYYPSGDPFQAQPVRPATHAEMLSRIQERFDALDKRLQRMEDIVTHPGFGLEEKYRDLK